MMTAVPHSESILALYGRIVRLVRSRQDALEDYSDVQVAPQERRLRLFRVKELDQLIRQARRSIKLGGRHWLMGNPPEGAPHARAATRLAASNDL